MTQQEDHDVLIEVRTNLANLTDEVRLMRDTVVKRVDALELHKVSIADFTDFKIATNSSITKLENDFQKLFDEHKKISEANDNNLSRRLTDVERMLWKIVGGLMLAQIAVPLILKFVFHL